MGVVSSMVDWMAGNEQTSKQLRAQSAENALNRQFSEHMYERQWADTLKNYPSLLQMQSDADFNKWKNQFNIESSWNSQGNQVARNLVAGINPAAQGSALTQGVSVSSGGVAPPPVIHGSPLGGSISPIGLPHHFDLDLFSQLGQFAKDLSQLDVNKATITKITNEAEKILADKDLTESLTAYQEIKNGITQVFGYKRESLELQRMIRDSRKLESEGDYFAAAKLNQKALARLNNSEAVINEEKRPFIAKLMQKDIERLGAEIRNQNAQAAEALSRKELNNANKELADIALQVKKAENTPEVFAQRARTLLMQLEASDTISKKEADEASRRIQQLESIKKVRNHNMVMRLLDDVLSWFTSHISVGLNGSASASVSDNTGHSSVKYE